MPHATARAEDRQGRQHAREVGLARPREDDRARHDRDHAERDPPVEILLEDEPRQKGGRDSFGVQQQ